MPNFPLRPRRLTWRSALLGAPLLLVIWMGMSSYENLRLFKSSDQIFLLLAEMQKTIDVDRSDGGKIVETDAGQHEMDQIRTELAAFLQDGYWAREAATSRTTLIVTLGAVALFLLLAFATILIERDRQRQRAYALHIQELDESKIELLSRSHADLEQVTWAASHDLKEPLRMVTTYSQLLIRTRASASEDELEFSRFIGEGVERMTALIDGLLSYARNLRVPAGKPARTEADTAARDALDSLENRIEERSAAIAIDPLPAVRIEPEALRNVFEQLILNALEFSREGVPPRIHVTALRQNDAVRFAIEDNGIGIEPEHHQRIFQLFRRLHGAEYPGIGVGLPLSRRLIENYGGRLWLESEPGVGSTFYFTLPAADSTLAAAS